MEDKQVGKCRADNEREKWYAAAVNVINSDKRVLFIRDVIDILPIGKSKFYELFPEGSAELENLHKYLDGNKVPQRLDLRQMMIEMRSPQTVLAIYKTIATPEEKEQLSSLRPQENAGGVSADSMKIDIEGYKEHVKKMLMDVNRYSPVLDVEIAAMSSAWATLNAANKTIASLDNPFLEEVTTQGKKVVQHPAFALQQKALESMSRHAKLLGIDYENAPALATDGPLASLTKEMISYTKAQNGHMSVDKEKGKKGKRKK